MVGFAEKVMEVFYQDNIYLDVPSDGEMVDGVKGGIKCDHAKPQSNTFQLK